MPAESNFRPRGAGQNHTRARWLAALAKRQHGVVARWQLLKLGFSRHEIDGLITRGHLYLLHRGVYAVGHARLTVKGRWMAAVLAAGPDAVLSHRAAIALWELRPIPSGPIVLFGVGISFTLYGLGVITPIWPEPTVIGAANSVRYR